METTKTPSAPHLERGSRSLIPLNKYYSDLNNLLPYELVKLKPTTATTWKFHNKNTCMSHNCPAPHVEFEAGDYVVIKKPVNNKRVRHYHPICASQLNIVYSSPEKNTYPIQVEKFDRLMKIAL